MNSSTKNGSWDRESQSINPDKTINADKSMNQSSTINQSGTINQQRHTRARKSEYGKYGTQENTGINQTQHTEMNNTHIIQK